MEFVAFPERKDSLLSANTKTPNLISVVPSGSIGQRRYDGKCQMTEGNETLSPDEKADWCSNIGTGRSDMPWIMYNLKNKKMRVNGYSIRNGCCYYDCCCIDDNTQVYDCCCDLYSFSLQGSNDKKTWHTIHKVEKDKTIYRCKTVTFDFEMSEAYTFIRVFQDEEYPGCSLCMAINQIDLYGTTVDESNSITDDGEDESVSIIGKVDRFSNE